MKPETRNTPALRFPEFNDEWETKKIEEGFVFKNGLNKKKEWFGTGTPIINFTDVFNESALKASNIRGLVTVSKAEQENFSCTKGDVFFTRTSETINDIGMSAVLLEDIPGCVFSGFVLRARPTKDLLTDSFKQYCFSIGSVRKEIVTKSSFTTRALTSGTLLNKVVFRFPKSKREQQKIAAFLSAVDEKIGQLARKKKLLLKYKKGAIQQIFDQKIRFKDDNGNEFPEWRDTSLSKFLIQTPREVATPSESYLAIGVRSHFKGTFQKPDSDPNKIEMDKLYVVRAGDLIVNITFAWEGAVAIAKKEDDGGLVSHRFPTYTFNENRANSKFFQYVYSSARFKHRLKLISPGGAGRNRVLNKKDFLGVKVLLPSIAEQTRIARFLVALDSKIDFVESQLENTKNVKKGLLQQMFV